MSYGSDGSYKMSGRTFFFFRKPKVTETNLEQLNRYCIKAFFMSYKKEENRMKLLTHPFLTTVNFLETIFLPHS